MKTPAGLAAAAPLLGAALLWGTLWIPLRELHATGAPAPLWVAAGYAIALGVLLPAVLRRRREGARVAGSLPAAGFVLAVSIALYAEGLVRGSVARVVLLFYLMPVWTALFARLRWRRRITRKRLAAIGCGIAGLAVIYGPSLLRGEGSASGDAMGLAAGIAWAAALVFLLPGCEESPVETVFAQFVFLAPISLVLSRIPGATPAGVDLARAGVAPIGWLLAFALVWMLPVVWLTIVGVSRMEPGRAAVLFMLEVAVALTSSAVFAGEPFGATEAVGAALVAGAGVLEVLAGESGAPSTG